MKAAAPCLGRPPVARIRATNTLAPWPKAARLVKRDRRRAFGRQQIVGDGVQIGRTVDQRPVKVEDDGGHQAAACAASAAARMAAMFAP